MDHLATSNDRILCHCLQVKQSHVETCVAICGSETVREVTRQCGAGGGCTACHSRIREVIAAHQNANSALEAAESVA